jgi:amino acid transporter
MSAVVTTPEKDHYEPGKDIEKTSSQGGYVTDAVHGEDDPHMHRKLKGRHISMIAIAGTIGTGLFLGSGKAVANGGPVGAVLGYTIVGCLVGAMMYSLGEMMVWDPSAAGFIEFSARYVDPALGFALGWGYWFQTTMTTPVEVVAAAIVIQYWDSNKSHLPAYIVVFTVPMTIINIVGVKYFGEFEFWFAFIKIAAIVGLILMCLVVMLGGGPDHDRRGFRYWRDEPFNSNYLDFSGSKSRFLGFWAVLTQAAFSYGGMETLASIALEAENPRVTMKTAVRAIFYRIVLLYVLSLWLVGLCVRRSDKSLLDANSAGDTAAKSPFVVVIRNAGIKVLDHIINAVVLTSAFSSGNEFMYASSRALFMLAQNGQAPVIFTKVSKQGVPIYAVGVTFLFSMLSFLTVDSGAEKAFIWLGNITALGSMITWWGIGITFLRFHKGMKVQGMSRDILPFHTMFQPYFAWAVVICFTVIIFFNGWTSFHGKFDVSNFFSSYINIFFVIILYFGWKFWHKTKIVPYETMDLSSHYQEGSHVYAKYRG